MARVYVARHEKLADLTVCKVERDVHADLLVHVVGYEALARGDELWHFVEHEKLATIRICWVEHEKLADLKVCFVDRESAAGWRTTHDWKGGLGIEPESNRAQAAERRP